MRNKSYRINLLSAATFLLLSTGVTWPATPADQYVSRTMKLVSEQRRGVARLTPHAERTGNALLAGGAFWIAGTDKGWVSEATGRAGGPAASMPLPSPEKARKGDVVWLSFSQSSYESDLKTAQALEDRGCIVTAFGPRPPRGRTQFNHLLDSLTKWQEDERLALMGNVLSLWSLTAEVANYTARQGKTLVMLQSAVVPGANERNAKYRKITFHEGDVSMQPVKAGVLASAYLDFVSTMMGGIRDHEMTKLLSVAAEVRAGARESRPACISVIGHMMPDVLERGDKLFRIVRGGSNRQGLAEDLRQSRLFVWLGYTRVSDNVVETVRSASVKAVWILASDAKPAFELAGDVVIDQNWKTGDAAVEVPGYDVRILPPSAVAQLFIYDILVRSAG